MVLVAAIVITSLLTVVFCTAAWVYYKQLKARWG